MLIWGARVFFSCITRRTSTTGRAQSSCSRPAVTRPFVTPAAGGAAMDLAAAAPPYPSTARGSAAATPANVSSRQVFFF